MAQTEEEEQEHSRNKNLDKCLGNKKICPKCNKVDHTATQCGKTFQELVINMIGEETEEYYEEIEQEHEEELNHLGVVSLETEECGSNDETIKFADIEMDPDDEEMQKYNYCYKINIKDVDTMDEEEDTNSGIELDIRYNNFKTELIRDKRQVLIGIISAIGGTMGEALFRGTC